MRQKPALVTVSSRPSPIAICEQNLDVKEQFKVFAKGLVRVLAASQPYRIYQPFTVPNHIRESHIFRRKTTSRTARPYSSPG